MMHKNHTKNTVGHTTTEEYEQEEYIGKIDIPQQNEKKTDIFLSDADIVKTFSDISANFKRRVARLQKVYSGVDASSKQLFPE